MLARLVITIDPDAARKRYREAVKHRQVWCGREEEGTLSLGGRRLPADRAAAAFDRLDALATALHEAGDTRGLEALRADVMLDLLQGLITNPQPHPDAQQAENAERVENAAQRGDRSASAEARSGDGADPGPGSADGKTSAAEPGAASAGGGGGLAVCPHGCRSGGGLELTVPGEHPDGVGRTPGRARLVGAGHRRCGPGRGPRPGHRAVAV